MITRVYVYTPEREQAQITPERTQTDLTALRNISGCFADKRSDLDHTERERITEEFLQLFSEITVERPDMIDDRQFPWFAAVTSALEPKVDSWTQRFSLRMSILKRAPEDVLKSMLADNAAAGGDILITLGYEQSTLHGDSMTSPEVIRLAQLLPEGNQTIAQTIFYWVGEAEMHALSRTLTHEDNPVQDDILRQMEGIAMEKWMSLSPKERQTFLTAALLVDIRGLYPEYLDDGKFKGRQISDLQPRMNVLLGQIVRETSPDGLEAIKKDLVAYLKQDSQLKLGIIEKWFPRISAEAIEEAKPAWQKIFSHKK